MNLGTLFIAKTNNLPIQFVRCLMVGGVAFLADFAALFLLTEFGHLYYLVSASIAFLVGVAVNYGLSIAWVFDQRTVGNKAHEFTMFALIGVIGLLLNLALMWFFTERLGLHYLGSKAVAAGMIFLFNFGARKIMLFTVRQPATQKSPGIPLLQSVQNKILPLELVALAAFAASLVLTLLFSLHYYLPGLGTARFIWYHYLGPMVIAMPISLIVLLLGSGSTRSILPYRMFRLCRLFAAFLLVVYLHFNFKLWAPLINQSSYDRLYFELDKRLASILEIFQSTSEVILRFIPAGINGYHEFFVAMFFASFVAHALTKNGNIFERVVTATGLVLTIGGLSYSLAPAFGPFIYTPSSVPFTAENQQNMLTFFRQFVDSGGAAYQGTYFASALAAMPSLHIANAVVFCYYALRYTPLLGIIYLPLCFYLLIEAVAAKWHYLADIPAGVLVAILALWITSRLVESKSQSPPPPKAN